MLIPETLQEQPERILDQRDILQPIQDAVTDPEIPLNFEDVTPDVVNNILDQVVEERHGAVTPSVINVQIRVEQGRWIADCPICNSGIAAWPENPTLTCVECHHTFPARIPSQDILDRALPLLLCRPLVNRNWRPDIELTTDLERENIEHGFGPQGNQVIVNEVGL